MKNTLCTAALTLCLSFVGLYSQAYAQDAAKENSFKDDKYDFSIEVPKEWKSVAVKDYTVPGIARAAYSGSKGASIVVFVQEAGQAFDARFLVDESAKSIEKALGAKVIEKDVRSIDEKSSMSLIIEGKGTGAALDGKGAVQTSQHWVAVPREMDIVVVLLTSTTDSFKDNEASFVEILKKLKIGGKQTAQQSAAK